MSSFRPFACRSAPVLLATLTACAALRPPLKASEEGGSAWHQIETEHFILDTDYSPEDAMARVQRYETLRAALEDVEFPPSGEPERAVTVVLFRNAGDYKAVGPLGTAGIFYARLPFDLERHPTMLVSGAFEPGVQPRDNYAPLFSGCSSNASASLNCWAQRGRKAETPAEAEHRFVHEMVHEFVHRAFGEAPLWLNEGLAQYFATMRVDDDRVVLGDPDLNAMVIPPGLLPSCRSS